MAEEIEPVEATYHRDLAEQRRTGDPWRPLPLLQELKDKARKQGLWNLFLPREHAGDYAARFGTDGGEGLTNVDYAPIAELTGRSAIAPLVLNCNAPDTGNMEVLLRYGTEAQRKEWLEPLLDGKIRSAFTMTEPDVASSDATNITTTIVRDGDDYVINGRKWWISGTADPRCQIFIVMGKTDPDGPPHRQQSMVLVPRDTPGFEIVRHLPVFGYQDQHGHSELRFTDVRVPATNILAGEGDGFMIAQARLGPGRIHHCMRAIGMAERALALMVERTKARVAFGRPLAEQGTVREAIALSRIEIDQARLYVLKTADLIDKFGAKGARTEISAIKVAAPKVALDVIDRAIQVHGGAGVSDDTPLAGFWAHARTLRIVDGPDAVHIRGVAKEELARERPYSA
jgi:acyl-CoA dehydrogenase